MSRLFIFGLGYAASHLAARLRAEGWQVAGTTRDGRGSTLTFEDANAVLPELAAAYAYGIAKGHAFVDGNKRTAFVTALTFLRLNGLGFRPDPVEGVRMMEDLASGDVSEAAFAGWLEGGIEGL